MEKVLDKKRAPAPAQTAARLSLRPVRWQSDLTAMMNIERAGFARPWDWEKFFRFSSRDDGQGVVALVNGAVVGFILCECRDDRVHVAHVAVHPTQQGLGIGRSLIKAACADGLPVTLNVRLSNLRAQELYARLDFQVCELKAAHYDDGEDALVMRRCPSQSPVTLRRRKPPERDVVFVS